MNANVRITREHWLEAAVEDLRPFFSERNHPLPEKIQVSMGFGSKGEKIGGQCFYPEGHADGGASQTYTIFIDPRWDRPLYVLGVLVHELLHAALPIGSGHGKKFKAGMEALGLTDGKPTAAMPGEELNKHLEGVIGRVNSSLIPWEHMPVVTRKRLSVMPGGGGASEGGNGDGGSEAPATKWRTFKSPENPKYTVKIGPTAWEQHSEPPICPISGRAMVLKSGPRVNDGEDDE